MIWDVKFVCDCPQRESRLLTSMDRLMPLPRNLVLIWASSKSYRLEMMFSILEGDHQSEERKMDMDMNLW